MIIYILSVFLLHLMVLAYGLSSECNPMECFLAFDTLFQPSNMETSCEKMTNLEECIKLCSANTSDNYFHQGLAEVKQDLCRNNRNTLENKCENKHKYSFAACIYEKFNYEAQDPNTKQNVLLCKQATHGDSCYENSLPMCSDRTGYLASTLLVKLFDPMRQINCVDVTQEDFDIELKSLPFVKDLQSLAECLDLNSPRLAECARRKWRDTNTRMEENNLCSDAQYFFDCVQKVIQSKCNIAHRTFFKSIREPILNFLLPQCSDKDISLSLQSPQYSFDTDSFHEDAPSASEANGLNEVKSEASAIAAEATKVSENSGDLVNIHSDASTIASVSPTHANKVSAVNGLNKFKSVAPTVFGNSTEVSGVHVLNKVIADASTTSSTNATEVRVLHQHVVITMTYKEKNAANQMCVCVYLVVLMILLGIWNKL